MSRSIEREARIHRRDQLRLQRRNRRRPNGRKALVELGARELGESFAETREFLRRKRGAS